jgi:hypothetical protein
MLMLKGTGIEWRERRLVSKLYVDHSVKRRLDQRETRSVKNGKAVRQLLCLSEFLSNLHNVYPTKEVLELFGYFHIEGEVIHTVKCADYLARLAKKKQRCNWNECGEH